MPPDIQEKVDATRAETLQHMALYGRVIKHLDAPALFNPQRDLLTRRQRPGIGGHHVQR